MKYYLGMSFYNDVLSEISTFHSSLRDGITDVKDSIRCFNKLGEAVELARLSSSWTTNESVPCGSYTIQETFHSIDRTLRECRDLIRLALRPALCKDETIEVVRLVVRTYLDAFKGVSLNDALSERFSRLATPAFQSLSWDWSFEITLNYFSCYGLRDINMPTYRLIQSVLGVNPDTILTPGH
ncbi:MAG: 21 kDa unknown protein [Plant associated closterovirus 1]|nr:MAG: 21 kDa unknown protein [Plant associated closterovirus 1]